MTGIFLLFVIALWIVIAIWLSKVVTKKLPEAKWRDLVQFLVFAVFMPLPVIDEIVGGWQFEKSCNDRAEVIIDARNIAGKTVWFDKTVRTTTQVFGIQITQLKRGYVDVTTQEPIYHYYRLEARGGWLIRTLGISEGTAPLLFSAVCQPKNTDTIDVQLGTKRINRPTSN